MRLWQQSKAQIPSNGRGLEMVGEEQFCGRANGGEVRQESLAN